MRVKVHFEKRILARKVVNGVDIDFIERSRLHCIKLPGHRSYTECFKFDFTKFGGVMTFRLLEQMSKCHELRNP